MRKHKALISTLDRALSTRRPHGEPMTYQFTYWLKDNLPPRLQRTSSTFFDDECNLHIDNRKTKKNRTLFVAHVDTVHRKQGKNNIDKSPAVWRAADKGQCLGADDGAGVALLMHMLHHDIPGYYIFTQGEECGGIGAKFLADTQAALLAQFDRAIAFDRKDAFDVITHQGWSRCCSDAFADALASALNETSPDQLMFMPCDGGVYTDTAEFTDIIPECTNISVGYDGAHGDRESLDMVHYQHLARAVVAIDWDGLPTKRDPFVVEPLTRFDGGWLGNVSVIDTVHPKGKTSKTAKAIEWTLEHQLYEAVDDARYGRFTPLMEMMAEAAYPEDPEMAKRLINRNALTDDLLDLIEDALDQGDRADAVLTDLFYEVHTQ